MRISQRLLARPPARPCVQEWKQWAEAGLFYGFTTNPTILKRDGVACNITSMRQLTREVRRQPGTSCVCPAPALCACWCAHGQAAASKQQLRRASLQAFSLGVSELQLQAWGTTAEEMYACGACRRRLRPRLPARALPPPLLLRSAMPPPPSPALPLPWHLGPYCACSLTPPTPSPLSPRIKPLKHSSKTQHDRPGPHGP